MAKNHDLAGLNQVNWKVKLPTSTCLSDEQSCLGPSSFPAQLRSLGPRVPLPTHQNAFRLAHQRYVALTDVPGSAQKCTWFRVLFGRLIPSVSPSASTYRCRQ